MSSGLPERLTIMSENVMTFDTAALQARARVLRDLHVIGTPLVLANAWDVASAAAVEAAGCAAIATSSNAMAGAAGVPDDNSRPPAPLFDLVRRIADATPLPVTVDAEGGYGLPAEELVGLLLKSGAVGCNIEDSDRSTGGLLDPERHAAYLASVRAAAGAAGVDLVINARIDTLVRHGDLDRSAKVSDVVHRGRAYLDAGADCVYPIQMVDPSMLREVVDALQGPVNANASSGATIGDLAAAGAARVSVGAAPFHRLMAELRARAERLLGGDGGAFAAG
jgi:2-methylisocitrate lyase-like PEP mutase family enzyme